MGRGTKKDRKEKNVPTEGSSPAVKCHRVPHQSCTQSSRSRDVKTCEKVPVESQREECKKVPQQTCTKVPSKTCTKVAVRVPVRLLGESVNKLKHIFLQIVKNKIVENK